MRFNEAEVHRKGLTPKVLIIGILICVLGSWFFGATHEGQGSLFGFWRSLDRTTYPFGFATVDTALAGLGGGLIIVTILTLVNRFKPTFSKQEMVVLMLITLVSTCSQWPLATASAALMEFSYPWMWVGAQETWRTVYLNVFGGTWLCPPPFNDYDYALAVAEGNLIGYGGNAAQPIDFGPWTTLYGYVTATFVAFALIGIGIALFVQRFYIDIEAVEFPWGEMGLVGFQQIESWFSKKKEGVRSKWFLIGFIPLFFVYMSMYMPNHLGWLFAGGTFKQWVDGFTWGIPWIPDMHPPGPLGIWEYDITQLGLSILPFAPLTLIWAPHVSGLMYLMPLDALIGVSAGALGGLIIFPIVMQNMGILGRWSGSDYKRAMRNSLHRAADRSLLYFAFGLILPLIVLPLWTHREIVKKIVRSTFDSKASKEADPDAPVNYRYVWLILIGGFILLLLGLSYAPMAHVLPVQLFSLFEMFAEARMITSGVSIGPMTYSHWDINTVQGPGAAPETLWLRINEWYHITYAGGGPIQDGPFLFWWLHYSGGRLGTSGGYAERIYIAIISMAIALLGFYLAKRLNLRKKDVFLTLILFLPLTMVLSNLFKIIAVYWIDMAPPPTGPADTGVQGFETITATVASGTYSWPTDSGFLQRLYIREGGSLAFGVILCTLLYFLRSRYGWLRLDPAGIFIGVTFPGLAPTIFIVLLLKVLTVRIGGVEFYQKVGKPLAVGFIFAWGANYFIHHGILSLFMWRTAFGLPI